MGERIFAEFAVMPPYDLGVQIGNIVRGAGSNPVRYRIDKIVGPRYWQKTVGCIVVYTYPVWHLTGLSTNPSKGGRGYFNEVRREGGRWFSGLSEIFIAKPRVPIPIQVEFQLFARPEETPWTFQDGVDYLAGDGRVFHCEKCGKDFNAHKTKAHNPYCSCGWSIPSLVIILARTNEATFRRTL